MHHQSLLNITLHTITGSSRADQCARFAGPLCACSVTVAASGCIRPTYRCTWRAGTGARGARVTGARAHVASAPVRTRCRLTSVVVSVLPPAATRLRCHVTRHITPPLVLEAGACCTWPAEAEERRAGQELRRAERQTAGGTATGGTVRVQVSQEHWGVVTNVL